MQVAATMRLDLRLRIHNFKFSLALLHAKLLKLLPLQLILATSPSEPGSSAPSIVTEDNIALLFRIHKEVRRVHLEPDCGERSSYYGDF